MEQKPIEQPPQPRLFLLKQKELIESGKAQGALNRMLDGPISETNIYPMEPKTATLRQTLEKYGVPIPSIDECKVELDVVNPVFFHLTLPQPSSGNMPRYLNRILSRKMTIDET
jgi:hypothetical protein